MNISRRQLLKNLGITACGSAVHPKVTGLTGWANKLTSTTHNDRILIVLQLNGGFSPNVAPTPDLRQFWQDTWPDTTIELNGSQHVHGALPFLKQLYDRGDLSVLNKVGYEGVTGSHDRDSRVWNAGIVGQLQNNLGWMTRAACAAGNDFAAISLVNKNHLVDGYCATSGFSGKEPATLDSLVSVGERTGMRVNSHDTRINSQGFSKFAKSLLDNGLIGGRIKDGQAAASGSAKLDYLYNEAYSLETFLITLANDRVPEPPTSDRLVQLEAEVTTALGSQSSVSWNGKQMIRDAKDIVRLIRMSTIQTDFKPRMFLMGSGGWDTHGNERPVLAGALAGLNLAIEYLYEACKALGIWNKVVIVTASEFSRTSSVQEKDINKTLAQSAEIGTEHGRAGPMIIMGGNINGGKNGIYSPTPTVNDMEVINQKSGLYGVRDVRVDFRQVYWDILNEHIGYDVEQLRNPSNPQTSIFPQEFIYDSSLKLFKT